MIELHRGLEILSTTAAAAKQAQALFEHHAGVDGHVVLGDAEQRHRALGVDEVDDLLDGGDGSLAAGAFEGVVDEFYATHVVDQMRLVGEREVVQLRFVATEHDDLRIRVPRMQKQRDDVAHVAIAPHANALASAMGNFIEAGDGVGGHAHKFGKSRYLAIHVLRE